MFIEQGNRVGLLAANLGEKWTNVNRSQPVPTTPRSQSVVLAAAGWVKLVLEDKPMRRQWAVQVWFLLIAVPYASLADPPEVTHLFPAGAQRGQSGEVTAGGRFESWPVRVWVEREGLQVKPLEEKGKLEVSVAGNASPGVYWMRFYNDEGSTTLKPFMVGTLPEILEKEPNNDPRVPQKLDLAAVTVNGVLKSARSSGRGRRGRSRRGGDVDGFAVSLRAGQTLVASIEANRRLGSPMDGVLQVVSADGFVLAQNDDAPDLDPQLVFPAPSDGTYTVRVFAFPAEQDSSIRFASGDQYVYRLTLTTNGFVDHSYPLAVAKEDPSRLELIGWNIPPEARTSVVRPSDTIDDVTGDPTLATLHHPGLANTTEVRLEPHATALETELNDSDNAQPIELPVTVTGRINPAGDADVYEFQAKKDQKLLFVVESRSLGLPLDPILRLMDAAGQTLSEADDVDRNKRDAELSFTVPRDGKFHLEVRDASRFGGLRYVYRLRALLAEAEFVATVAADRFTLTSGEPLEIAVSLEARNGFDGEVEIAALDLPAGVVAKPVKAKPRQRASRGKRRRSRSQPGGAAAAKLQLTVEPNSQAPLAAFSGPIRIIARSTGSRPISRTASATIPGVTASTTKIWLTVKQKGKQKGK